MQIMDQFGAAPGAESVRMPDGTERTLAAEHAAAILVNEQPAFRVVCTPELLPQLALGRLLTEGWITSADEVERVAVCAFSCATRWRQQNRPGRRCPAAAPIT